MTILLFLGKLALATVVPVAGVCLLLWVTGRPSRHTLRDLAKAAHDLADQEALAMAHQESLSPTGHQWELLEIDEETLICNVCGKTSKILDLCMEVCPGPPTVLRLPSTVSKEAQ